MLTIAMLPLFLSVLPSASLTGDATQARSVRLLVQADEQAGPEGVRPSSASEESPPQVTEEPRRAYQPDTSSRLSLEQLSLLKLDQRERLLDQKPGLGLPIGMFVGSAAAAFGSFVFLSIYAPLVPSATSLLASSSYGSLGAVVLAFFVVGIVLGVAHFVMGIVGATQMAQRMKARDEVDVKVERIDGEVRDLDARLRSMPRF